MQFQPAQQNAPNQQIEGQAVNWDFWPKDLPAIGQQAVQEQVVPPIQQAAALLQDLNEEPNLENPAEVIIHPPQALAQVLPQDQDLD